MTDYTQQCDEDFIAEDLSSSESWTIFLSTYEISALLPSFRDTPNKSAPENLYLSSRIDIDWKLRLHLNEGSGTIAYDYTIYQNNGTLLPSDTLPIWELNIRSDTIWTGYFNKNYFLEFNGINNFLDCGNGVNPRTQLTVMAWIKPDILNTDKCIVSKNETGEAQWKLDTTDLGELRFDIYQNQSTLATAICPGLELGKWQMVTGTYDGSSLTVYINNAMGFPPTAATFSIQDVDVNLRVGLDPVNNRYFDGRIDEVRVWDRALTWDEINSLYTGLKDKYDDPIYQTIILSDGISRVWSIKQTLIEASQLVEILVKKIFLGKIEIFRSTDTAFTYATYGGLSFDIKIFRDNSELEVDQGEVLSFTAVKRINTEVGEFTIVMDNDPKKEYRSGDAVEVWWTTGTSLTKVFAGEIDEVEEGQEEDKTISLRGKDWAKLLLEKKITKSYATATNVKTIIQDIMAETGIGTVGITYQPNNRIIDIGYIYAYESTRTLDFVGEPILDCLIKIAEATQSDFFVDSNKVLRFFPRGSDSSGMTFYGGGTIARGDPSNEDNLEDYFYDLKKDSIINSVKCYGSPTKPYPLDLDTAWTEGITSWNVSNWTGTSLSEDSTKAKAGSKSVKLTGSGASGDVVVGAEVDLGQNWNLTKKESFTKLKWANRIYSPGTNPYVKDVIVYLKDEDERGLQYKYRSRPEVDRASDQIHFPEEGVPVGPTHQAEGEWETAQDVSYVLTRSDTCPVSSYGGGWTSGQYTTVGNSPWLTDEDNNYIQLGTFDVNGYHNRMGIWEFGDIGSTLQTWNITSVNVHIWSRYSGTSGGQIYVYWQLPGINYYQNNARVNDAYTTPNPNPIPFQHVNGDTMGVDDGDTSYINVRVERDLAVSLPVNGFAGQGEQYTDWDRYPSNWFYPDCIATDDDDSSYIERNGFYQDSMAGYFLFSDFTITDATITQVKLYIKAKNSNAYPNSWAKIRILLKSSGSTWTIATFDLTSGSYQFFSWDVSSQLDTVAKINDARVAFVLMGYSYNPLYGNGTPRITYSDISVKYNKTCQDKEDYTWTFQDMQSSYVSTPLNAVRFALKGKNVIAYGSGDNVTIQIYLDPGTGYTSAGTLTWSNSETSYLTKYLNVSSIIGNVTKFNACKLKIKCTYINPGTSNSSDLRLTYCYLEADGYGTAAFSPGYYSETNASWTQHTYTASGLTSFTNINGVKLILRGTGSAGQLTEITKVSIEVNLSKAFGFSFTSDGNPFEWDHVRYAAFYYRVNRTDTSNIEVNIDWLHWDEGKYYGEYEDIPTGDDLKFIEIFDETIFSDTAALTKARNKVYTYRDPIALIDSAQADMIGSEALELGETVTFKLPENTFSPRVKELRYEFQEGDMDEYLTAWERG